MPRTLDPGESHLSRAKRRVDEKTANAQDRLYIRLSQQQQKRPRTSSTHNYPLQIPGSTLYVKPVEGKELGLFSTRALKTGDAIGDYTGDVYTVKEFERHPDVDLLGLYAVQPEDTGLVIAPPVVHTAKGPYVDPLIYPIAIANEATAPDVPNAKMKSFRGVPYLSARKPIPANTEITWYYGSSYDAHRTYPVVTPQLEAQAQSAKRHFAAFDKDMGSMAESLTLAAGLRDCPHCGPVGLLTRCRNGAYHKDLLEF